MASQASPQTDAPADAHVVAADTEEVAAPLPADNEQQQQQPTKKARIERHDANVSGIMSSSPFTSLDLTSQTQKVRDHMQLIAPPQPLPQGIAELGHTTMTEVQARTIPPLLQGRDVLAAAKTGTQQQQCCLRTIPPLALFLCCEWS